MILRSLDPNGPMNAKHIVTDAPAPRPRLKFDVQKDLDASHLAKICAFVREQHWNPDLNKNQNAMVSVILFPQTKSELYLDQAVWDDLKGSCGLHIGSTHRHLQAVAAAKILFPQRKDELQPLLRDLNANLLVDSWQTLLWLIAYPEQFRAATMDKEEWEAMQHVAMEKRHSAAPDWHEFATAAAAIKITFPHRAKEILDSTAWAGMHEALKTEQEERINAPKVALLALCMQILQAEKVGWEDDTFCIRMPALTAPPVRIPDVPEPRKFAASLPLAS